MADELKDPFVEWLNKWKWRLEQTTIFFILVMHLIFVIFIGFSALVQHACKLANELQNIPVVEESTDKTKH
jgi:hypothetical protein